MRRADRLFEILQLLRGDRLRTARDLAEKLEVSTRTIWRDIFDLQAQGIPVAGERGVGYLLQNNYFLPPLALSAMEMEALIWGATLVEGLADGELADAARELRIKIAAVSPEERRNVSSAISAFAPQSARAAQPFLGTIRNACRKRQKLAIRYRDINSKETTRVVRPLGLEFWGQVWTMTGWCESRSDFRVFRCDRLASCELLDECFREEKGKRFRDFLEKLSENKRDDKAS